MKAHGAEVMGDLPNFTNVTPEVQISEVVAERVGQARLGESLPPETQESQTPHGVPPAGGRSSSR